MTDQRSAALLDYAYGALPATIALSRLLTACGSEAEARLALDGAIDHCAANGEAAGRLRALDALWAEHPEAFATLSATLERLGDTRSGRFSVADWAQAFDRVVEGSPEASVAIYSLGSKSLLDMATQDVCGWMADTGLLGPQRDGLDLGCGIGRFLEALAPHMRSLVGVDVSGRMVDEARRRCSALTNVKIMQESGQGLESVASDSIDLVLASDVFPYLVDVGQGLPNRHLAECTRVLRRGGYLLILNYAYAGSDADHIEALSESISSTSLRIVKCAERPFRHWDAAVYLLQRSGARSQARLRA